MTFRPQDETDLTDSEWEHLKPLVPGVKPGGRSSIHSRRELLNGIFYAVRSGCGWKLLPHDLPPWRTVYHYFWSWRRDGTWQRIHDSIRTLVRKAAGRHAEASGAVVDSQSVGTSEQGGMRGYDAAKRVCGRKRHILVDTLGLVLLVFITAADVQDRTAARILLGTLATRLRRLRAVWADGAYAGGLQHWVRRLRLWGKVRLEIVRKPKDSVASRSCHGAGSWSERLRGWAGGGASRQITSVCPRRSRHSSTLP